MRGGAYDQREGPQVFGAREPYRPLDERPDVLSFATAPLDRDIEIAGPVSARLWIASDCPDTDFTAKLIDVHPPSADYPHGFAMNLTEGLLRLRYRDSWEKPELMAPGQVYAITIELFPIGNLFVAGHRLRLDISSSNFPHFDVNPNSGEPEGLDGTSSNRRKPRLRRPRAALAHCFAGHPLAGRSRSTRVAAARGGR